jgi:hypothetical protein
MSFGSTLLHSEASIRQFSTQHRRRKNNATSTNSSELKPPSRRFRNNAKWGSMIDRLRIFREQHGHANVPSSFEDRELFTWVRAVRSNYRHQVRSLNKKTNSTVEPRLQLPSFKLEQLNRLDFVWEVKEGQWYQRYQELCDFQQEHGHTRVPTNYSSLGVWAANQRRDYQLFQWGKPTKILNDERIRLLDRIQFEWSRSHEDSWQQRYRELQDYVEQNGHANVPEDYPENVALGQWCMNQRTAYRLHQCSQQHSQPASAPASTSMTPGRVALLEAVGFSWNVLDTNWWNMLQRLKVYHQANGHLQISTSDLNNMDLRVWLIVQRHQYHRRQENRTSTMTSARIQSIIEAIPDFQWKARGSDVGPSPKDWEQLFSAIRAKGIAPGMRPKEHWFEGQNRFDASLKDTWTDEDLLALWHQEETGGS